jgi:hypothetical protein
MLFYVLSAAAAAIFVLVSCLPRQLPAPSPAAV